MTTNSFRYCEAKHFEFRPHYLLDFPKAESYKEHIKASLSFTKLLRGKDVINIGLLPTVCLFGLR